MNIDERRAQIVGQREFEKKWHDLLSKLSKKELIELNKMIVFRVQLMNKLDNLGNMVKFKIGDVVKWKNDSGGFDSGTIIRLNTKSATVQGNQEGYWRISPQLLSKVE